MKNKINRILSLVMALVLLCAVVPMTAAAAEADFKIDQYGRLTGYRGPGGDVVIPDGVTAIAELAFKNHSRITSVVIPDSVTEIGYMAFACCTRLTSVTIPNSVTEIDSTAFWNCTSLTSVVIPDRIRVIRPGTFKGCTSLTSVTIPDSVVAIEYDAFKGCTSLASVTIREDVRIYSDSFDPAITVIRQAEMPTPVTLPDPVPAPVTETAETQPETQPEVKTEPAPVVQKFNDVSPDSPYFEAVNALGETGLFLGDGNGNFNPDGAITCGEFAVLLCRIYGIPIEEHRPHRDYSVGQPDAQCDGSYSWASAAIQTTAKLRTMPNGSPGKLTWWECYDANELMNRGETVRYLMVMYVLMHPEMGNNYWKFLMDRDANGIEEYRIEKFTYTEPATSVDGWAYTAVRTGMRIAGVADENLNDQPYKGMTSSFIHNWDVNAIAAAYILGIVHSDANGYFNPLNNMTRGELCQWLYNAGVTAPGCVK